MAEKTQMLDVRQEQYLNWLLAPAHERTPATQAQFAEQLGVDPTTLRRWEKKEYFKKEWERRVNDLQGSPERTQRLLDALYNKAIDGDTRAANLYLQATHRLLPPPAATSSKSMTDLSDDELDALIAKVAEREKNNRQLKAI
jgi:transcriptional regulator with XRE-family HTH domain